MAASILRYELKGTARTRARPENFRVVLGPFTQCCPCEASEQDILTSHTWPGDLLRASIDILHSIDSTVGI